MSKVIEISQYSRKTIPKDGRKIISLSSIILTKEVIDAFNKLLSEKSKKNRRLAR
jgi:hypothetical protein